MIRIVCNVCTRIVRDDDADATRGAMGRGGERVDHCGRCALLIAEEAPRLVAALREQLAEPVAKRALSVRLPAGLTSRKKQPE